MLPHRPFSRLQNFVHYPTEPPCLPSATLWTAWPSGMGVCPSVHGPSPDHGPYPGLWLILWYRRFPWPLLIGCVRGPCLRHCVCRTWSSLGVSSRLAAVAYAAAASAIPDLLPNLAVQHPKKPRYPDLAPGRFQASRLERISRVHSSRKTRAPATDRLKFAASFLTGLSGLALALATRLVISVGRRIGESRPMSMAFSCAISSPANSMPPLGTLH